MGTLTDFSFLNEGENNTSKSTIGHRGSNLDYRRSQAELREYTKMKELEKNQAALTRIQTLDFQDVLRRYYKNRPQILEDGTMLENKDFDGMDSTELLHYFYNDRTWRKACLWWRKSNIVSTSFLVFWTSRSVHSCSSCFWNCV